MQRSLALPLLLHFLAVASICSAHLNYPLVLCRVLDVYTGKTAKLNDTALQTAQNVSAFLRYSKGDYNLTDPAIPPIVLPEPQADWGNFSLINLPGKATFPVITTAMIVSGSDLSQLGEHCCFPIESVESCHLCSNGPYQPSTHVVVQALGLIPFVVFAKVSAATEHPRPRPAG